ncbi:MAG: DNA polymerase III subunit gamma/tau [Sporolactobacillus sp.]
MVYQALYRAYRPQTFEEIAGQQHITRTLQHALLKNQFSHAYLFTGPRGTGKTSAAKIMAKAINCEHAPAKEPCNQCAACLSVTEGRSPDVIEIDAASNNGVDEIRDIRDKVKYAPSELRFKVYIIDEVHMLSTGAFNALLKTLEEPPEHVVFILATTEPQKIPLTIISRCQQFDFRRVPAAEIAERLTYVVQDRQLQADPEALNLIARVSDGGMRDALSVLDQTAAYSDGQMTVADVQDVTGLVADEEIGRLGEALLKSDATTAVRACASLLDQGKDAVRLTEQLLLFYRDLLLYRTSPKLEDLLSRPRVDDAFCQLAEMVERDVLYQTIAVFNQTLAEMRQTNYPRILLETCFVKVSDARMVVHDRPVEKPIQAPSTDIERRVETLEKQISTLASDQQRVSQRVSAPPSDRRPHMQKSDALKIPLAKVNEILSEATKDHLFEIRQAWTNIMAQIRTRSVAAHAWLIDSQPVAGSQNAVILAFKHDFHCQMVMENKNHALELAQTVVTEVMRCDRKIYPVPEESWEKIKKAFIERTKAAKGTSTSEFGKGEDPLVAEARKLVGTDLLEIKE